MSVSASIPDTSLGLTSSEIQILRQQQQIALQGSHGANGISRGRGTGRTSNSSSRAASAASSQGRLLLDPLSLRALSQQLDALQQQIRSRIDYVCLTTPTLCNHASLSISPSPRVTSLHSLSCRLNTICRWWKTLRATHARIYPNSSQTSRLLICNSSRNKCSYQFRTATIVLEMLYAMPMLKSPAHVPFWPP